MESTIWKETILPAFSGLNRDAETDVLVIGGGICGILCAYRLSKNYKVILVEANQLASSRTNKTTATITALQDILYKDLIHQKGKQSAKLYLDANLKAIEEYAKLAEKYDFDFERVCSYKYFKNNRFELEEELNAIQELGFNATISDDYAICFANQAQMNPLKLISHLLSNFDIYEHTRIIQLKRNIAYTKEHKIKAKHIIVATGYPFLKLKGLFPLKLYQNKSYVAVLDDIENKESFHAIGYEKGDFYFRTYKDKLIIGGNDQKTGKTNQGFLPLVNHIIKNYPHHFISYQWVNQDCISLDGIPYIGKYGNSKNVYVATGFNLWGMTSAMIASLVLSDRIEGKENPYSKLFSPSRKMLVLPMLKNIGTAALNLIRWNKRCTHLGCALYYNEEEQTYECPCHGTKYDVNGSILFNPAQKNKK